MDDAKATGGALDGNAAADVPARLGDDRRRARPARRAARPPAQGRVPRALGRRARPPAPPRLHPGPLQRLVARHARRAGGRRHAGICRNVGAGRGAGRPRGGRLGRGGVDVPAGGDRFHGRDGTVGGGRRRSGIHRGDRHRKHGGRRVRGPRGRGLRRGGGHLRGIRPAPGGRTRLARRHRRLPRGARRALRLPCPPPLRRGRARQPRHAPVALRPPAPPAPAHQGKRPHRLPHDPRGAQADHPGAARLRLGGPLEVGPGARARVRARGPLRHPLQGAAHRRGVPVLVQPARMGALRLRQPRHRARLRRSRRAEAQRARPLPVRPCARRHGGAACRPHACLHRLRALRRRAPHRRPRTHTPRQLRRLHRDRPDRRHRGCRIRHRGDAPGRRLVLRKSGRIG